MLNLCLAEWTHSGYIVDCFRSIFSAPERRYEDSPKILTRIFSSIFCIGIIAITLYIAYYKGGAFTPITLIWIVGLVIAIYLIKNALLAFTAYVFALGKDLVIIRSHRISIGVVMGMILLLGVMLKVHFPQAIESPWIFASILLIYWLIIFLKTLRGYMYKPLSFLYIVLYFFTLEVLPLAGLIFLSKKVILNV